MSYTRGEMRRLGIFFLCCGVAVGGCSLKEHSSARQPHNPAVVVVDPAEFDQPQPVPEQEPNDSWRQAQLLQPALPVEGSMSAAKKDSAGKDGAAEADRDWYRLEAPEGEHILRAMLSGVAGVDLILEAYDSKRQRLVRVNNGKEGEGEILVNLAVSAGTYYLLIKGSETKDGLQQPSGAYRLSYELRAPEQGEEREPNWKKELATPLALDTDALGYLGWHTDTDWYAVDLSGLPAGARLRVEFDGLDEVSAHLAVHDSAGVALQERWGRSGASITLPNLAPPSGQALLYVVLRCRNQVNVETRYALRVVTDVPAGPTEAEPNDSPASATRVSHGVPITGSLVDTVDHDFFAVQVERPQVFAVEVQPPLQLDVALAVMDGQGAVVLERDEGGARSSERFKAVWAFPPRLLLRVRAPRSDHVSDAAPYVLSVQPLSGTDWEQEPNDQSVQATVWSWAQPRMRGHVYPAKDVDYFRLKGDAVAARYTLRAPEGCAFSLELLAEDSEALVAKASVDRQGSSSLEVPASPGEIYLLRVTGHMQDAATCPHPYLIEATREGL